MNSLSLLVLALFAACVSCFTEVEYQNAFTNWMQSNQKVYASEEFQSRYAVFKFNMDYVTKWNALNTETELGLNVFADLSNEEYRKIYLGTRITRSAPAFDATFNPTLPASVDWRNQSAVTPIKNQGQCGSCWSFSTTGSTEGIHALTTKNLVSLSEQNLMDCSKKYGNDGCNGGLMDQAFQYIIDNKGIDTEASYPYKAVDGTCKYSAANIGATLTGYVNVTTGSESDLQVAAAQQPVSVAIDASASSFQLYTKGVYYEPSCSSTNLDHGVLVIGYGTDGSTPYWLVKNSWGTSWGQAGYIWMSRNRNNNCGIATMASYPLASGSTATSGSATSASASSSSTHTSTHAAATTGHATAGHAAATSGSHSGNGNSGTSSSTYSAVGTEQFKQSKGGVGFKAFKDQTEKFNF